MNEMTQTTSPPAPANSLWAAVGVLGVVVLALGSALYFVQTQKEELRAANTASEAVILLAATPPPTITPEPALPPPPRPQAKKLTAVQAKHAIQVVKSEAPADNPVTMSSPALPPLKVREVCLNCGTVTASTPIEREDTGSGAGAVGGGVAGNTVGKKKQTVFQVQVRLDDGSTRKFEQADPLGAGARVRVEGNALRLLTVNR